MGVIKQSSFFTGTNLPVSIDAKNITHARVELAKFQGKAGQSKEGDTQSWFRGLYNIPKKNFIIWYAMDGLHDDMMNVFKLKRVIKIVYDVALKGVTLNFPSDQYTDKQLEIMRDKFRGFFGTHVNWKGDQPVSWE